MGLLDRFITFNKLNGINAKMSPSSRQVAVTRFGGKVHPDAMLPYYEQAYGVYSTLYSCADEIAKNIAGLPFKIYQHRTKSNGEIEKIDISSDRRFTAFYRPNNDMTRYQFDYATITHLITNGEMFIETVKSETVNEIAELWFHKPSRMTIITNEDGIVRFDEDINGRLKSHDKDNIVYLRIMNPFNDFRGLSPLKVLQLETALGINALKFGNNFFINGAKISGIYSLPANIEPDDDMMKRLKEDIRNEYGGVDSAAGAYSIMVLEGEGEYKPIGINQSEMQYLEQIEKIDERICGVMGVPQILIGITKSQSHANVDDQRKLFWNDTLKPLSSMLADMRNYFLLPKFTGDDPIIKGEYDLSGVEPLHEDVNEKSKRVLEHWLNGIATLDQACVKLGYEPVGGKLGSLRLVPAMRIPLEDLAGITSGGNGEKKEIDSIADILRKHLSDKMETIYINDYEQLDSHEIIEPEVKQELYNIPLQIKDYYEEEPVFPNIPGLINLESNKVRTQLWRQEQKQRGHFEKLFIGECQKIFRKQRDEVLGKVKNVIRKSNNDIKVKADPEVVITDVDFEALVLDIGTAAKLFEKSFKKIRIQQLEWAIERLSKMTEIDLTELNLSIADPEIRQVLRSREKFIQGITKTTNEAVKLETQRAVEDAIEKGLTRSETIEQITSRVQNKFAGMERWRARRIAVTETTSVQCGLQQDLMLRIDIEKKMWISQRDDRVRDEHVQMDGEVVATAESFSNGLLYPMEPNCRCDIIPFIPETSLPDISVME